ncbi:MAG: MFS transporter [Pirellulales bacterium]
MIRTKLFAMMFLEFFIWGAWLPLIFGYLPSLGFNSLQQSLILNAFPAAAILAMFFSNQFADRYFAAERFLAISHLIGGASILALAWVTPANIASAGMPPSACFWLFFSLMLVHCIFYVPTISITNAIAFASMKDAQQEFGIVRMGGTIGWIAAAWPPVFLLVDWAKVRAADATGAKAWLDAVLASPLEGQAMQNATAWTYVVAGIASLLLAGFSLILPHTPPKPNVSAEKSLAWLEAMRLLAHPFVLILWLVTFIDAFVHNCYFNWTGRFLPTVGIPGNWVTPVMSVGQVAEILTMAVLGLFLKRLGMKLTMTIGILGHAVRFGVFAFCGTPDYMWLIVGINILHGVCYAFFFATVYIFVDEYFPKDARTSAQGLFNLMILGLGGLVANFVCPWLFDDVFKIGDLIAAGEKGMVFQKLFLVPAGLAVLAAALLVVAFYPPKKPTADAA